MTSKLIVNSIRHTGASADAITMDASGNVTFPANATCSGTATGFGGGITQADIIRFNTNASLTYDTVTVVDSNWERPDESDDVFDKIGSGMSESSGIFTFPATGIYLVTFIARFYGTSNSNQNTIYIDATVNNSTYVSVAQSSSLMSGNGQMTVIAQSFLDITDTTNRKVRFKVYAAANNQQILGN